MSDQEDKLDINRNKEDEINPEDENANEMSIPNNEKLDEESTSKTINAKSIKSIDSQEDILLNESTSTNKHKLESNEISTEGTDVHRQQQQQHLEHVDSDNDNDQIDMTQSLNEQTKKVIDPELFYNIDEYIVYPIITENSGIPMNLLTVYHLFGMDVSRRENLQLIKYNILCHIYGNYLQLINMDTNEKTMIRSLNGIGIGAFCIHPQYKYIAIAEKGELPIVGIYQYPDIKLYRILRGGTQTAYSACQFCPNGELLATVGCHPDYMLTIWEWRNEQIMLRCKAFSQEIYHITWSIDLIGKLTTTGIEHIKFWQISTTFTGLKLQGKLGKFDRINSFNVEGITILPDGKVLTTSNDGNLLVWEDNLIKVQITRKNKQSCHNDGCIMQIIIDEGELMTIGQDGWIRTWDFETVDTAECSEEGEVYELEPMNELRVGTTANLMHIVKIPLPNSTMWYAQDADGALWKLDLSFSHTSLAPECLEEFHANDIVDCVTSPLTYCAATVGLDGKVCIYDIVQKKILVSRRFPSGGSSLIWSPPQVDPKGKILVVGHQDGVLRVLKFGENPEELTKRSKQFALLDLGQALKPHKSAITSMIYSPSGKLFVTGSQDETVFFFSVQATHLSPIGFINVYGKVVRLEWFYGTNQSINEIIVYLENGCVITVQCPLENEKYDHSKTFALNNLQITKSYQLMSIKSRLDHEEDVNNRLVQYNKAKEIRQEIRQMNARLQPETDEDKQKLDDAEEAIYQGVLSEISDWTPTYPTNPSPLLYGCLDRNEPNQFWISMGDFDKGYIYKCELGGPLLTIDDAIKRIHQLNNESKLHDQMNHDVINSNELHKIRTRIEDLDIINSRGIMLTDRIIATEPNKAVSISNKKDSCITCWTFSNTGYRLLIGFNDGVICVQLLEKPFDMTICKGFWIYRLHDNQRGRVNRIALTYDEKFVLSAGSDGTLFVCELMTEEMQNTEIKEYRARIPSTFDTTIKVDDITDPNTYSIEETKQKLEQDHLMKLAEERKFITRQKLVELKGRFKKLKEQNNHLPERIRLSTEAFNLVPQIRCDLFNSRQAEIDLVYRETAWETEKHRLALEKLENRFTKPLDCDRITVKAFCTGHCVTSIRMNKLNEEHLKVYNEIVNIRERMLTEEKCLITKNSAQLNTVTTKDDEYEVIKTVTSQLDTSIKGARGLRVMQKLHLLEAAKRRRAIRRAQWKQLEAMKPTDNYDDPKDTEAIQLAIEKLGDYKLKSSTNYVIPESMKLNTFEVKSKLINLVDHMYKLRHQFNVSLLMLRNKKMKILEKLKNIDKQLQENNCNLPLNEFGIRLYIEELDEDEYPEKKFTYNNEILLNFKKQLENDSTQEPLEPSKFTTSTTVKMSSSNQLPFTESTLPKERCHLKEPEIVKEYCNNNGNNDDSNKTQAMNVVWIPLHCLNWDNLHIVVPTNSDQMYSLMKPSFRYTFDEILINHHLDSNETTSEQPTEQQHNVNKSIIVPIYQPIKPDKMSTYIISDSKLANNEDDDKNLSENNIMNQSSTVKSL
ncbi:Cilia- and flagella-associated protein [Schistosoma japonicum]|uniref:Cilia-and flagella-associated protein n=1 Tax=Schistosoma japonicum TaxID=6182 RepID=A0A4Z2CU42_SCHJA|nr:Cilia- and flagella-associated protein [Schistosoma japonicum]